MSIYELGYERHQFFRFLYAFLLHQKIENDRFQHSGRALDPEIKNLIYHVIIN